MVGLALLLTGCDHSERAAERLALEQMLAEVTDNLVFVEGGSYLMGDYGPTHTKQRLSYGGSNTRPLHEVTLDSFYMAKFKITNAEYQRYSKLNNLDITAGVIDYRIRKFTAANAIPILPAHLFWQQAHDYCQWLAKQTGLAFALPTEAQWEYAARSRGELTPAATDTGWLQPGINMSAEPDRIFYANRYNTGLSFEQALPGDYYPPNPLGIYDMVSNGFEWMQDWYDPDYYAVSPKDNPRGPATPAITSRKEYDVKQKDFIDVDYTPKAVRSGVGGGVYSVVFDRQGRGHTIQPFFPILSSTGRCVVNQVSLADK